jgi:signal transduction histidine kinase
VPADLEIRAHRMDIITRWADDLAHEIKNPLHAMVINLELVKRRAGSADPAPLVQRAELVESELHRVNTLIESLLRLVRPWVEKDRADVDSTFQDLLPIISARARIRKLDFRHTPGGASVALGPGPLALLILDLVDRAIDALGEGGVLETACETTAGEVRIDVVHTPSHPAPAPADPSGLGLAITRRLVQDAGGDLEMDPAPGGGGMRATVLLPRVSAA